MNAGMCTAPPLACAVGINAVGMNETLDWLLLDLQ